MPDVTGLLGQGDARGFFAVSVVEQTQLDADGMFGKDGEVGTVAIPGRTEWVGAPGPDGYRHSVGALNILLNQE